MSRFVGERVWEGEEMLWDGGDGVMVTIEGGRVRRRGYRWAKGEGLMQAWYGTMDFEIFQNGPILCGNGARE